LTAIGDEAYIGEDALIRNGVQGLQRLAALTPIESLHLPDRLARHIERRLTWL
jgi:hypothetical protein